MNSFMRGVLHTDSVVEYYNSAFELDNSVDAGLILGYTLENNLRKHIITTLESHNVPRIYIDSNILNYNNTSHEWHRYSLNSVSPNDGNYFLDNIDKNKWNDISSYHNVELKPWRTSGNHILILCQRSNGWNLFGENHLKWIFNTIHGIRNVSDRPIIIRLHPGDKYKNLMTYELNRKAKNVIVSENPNIRQDLENCWCTVGYNSTPNVISIIEGIPNIIYDPKNSWAAECAGNDIAMIESPLTPDRSEWIHKIANIHWSNDEIKSGKLWSKIKNYISSVRQEI